MAEIRKLRRDEIDGFVGLLANAFPGMQINTAEDRKKARERTLKRYDLPGVTAWGYFRDERLLGCLALHDYKLTIRGTQVFCGGGGALAVDLPHKKEHIAKDLVDSFFRHYREREAPVIALWPFRPDFYRRMGVGFGAPVYQYNVRPDAFPKSTKDHIRFLANNDLPALVECHNRYAARTTGMIEDILEYRRLQREFVESQRYVGVEIDGRLEGYLVCQFVENEPGHWLQNNMKVTEFIYNTPGALAELSTFLHTQSDQVYRVILYTPEPDFFHLLGDARFQGEAVHPPVNHETLRGSIGIMYRVVDIPKLFELLAPADFNGVDATVEFNVADSFLPENAGRFTVAFKNGRPQLTGSAADIAVSLDIADFSSLIMGGVDFSSLCRYGRVKISSESAVGTISRLFRVDHPPYCTMSF